MNGRGRDRLAVILVLCVFWAFVCLLLGLLYRTGYEVALHPRQYYIHWYDWGAAAALPLFVAAILGAWWAAFGRRNAAE